jgi:outer membrane protein insertion porin family
MTSKVVLKFRVTPLPTRLLFLSLLVAGSGCARWSPQETGQLWQGYPATPAVQSGTPAATPPSGTVLRGQNDLFYSATAGSDDLTRYPMSPAGGEATGPQPPADGVRQIAYQPAVPGTIPPGAVPPGTTAPPGTALGMQPQPPTPPIPGPPIPGPPTTNNTWLQSPYLNEAPGGYTAPPEELGTPVPFDVYVEEARTGRFMFGAGVNSDAGVTGQIIVDERNFNLFRFPTSFADIANGEAFRGAGQAFRLEAVPGNRVQRYLVSFTEPYLFSTPISLNLSGFLYDRGFYDWSEGRYGGRGSLGYRITPDLSVTGGVRAESVEIRDPRKLGVPELDRVLGKSDLFSGSVSVRHDTRDMPFSPTEGHLIEFNFEQTFGDYDYSRAEVDYRRYFLLRERADGSGRHTLGVNLGAGFTGSDTPIFENYFAGGFSTLRGFEFRGASPIDQGVTVGGEFRMLGSVQYMMPLTADDMIKAVTFVDFGTVERNIEIDWDNFRVAPGFGFRISVPALGPAPLAFDFAFPVAQADTDNEQIFSFFFGFGRG